MSQAPKDRVQAGNVEQWIAEARGGSREALGRLLDFARAYLLLIANEEAPAEVRGKVGASDLVQDTFVKVQEKFAGFQGDGEGELFAWLRRILLNHIANERRKYATKKRKREVSTPDDSVNEPAADTPSPSSNLAGREQSDALQRAVARLSKRDRQVLQWRHYERLPFDEIGRRLDGRTAEAARKIWVRTLLQLQELLEPTHGPTRQ